MNGIIRSQPNHIEQKLFSARQITVTIGMAGMLAGSILIGIAAIASIGNTISE